MLEQATYVSSKLSCLIIGLLSVKQQLNELLSLILLSVNISYMISAVVVLAAVSASES